MQRRHDRTAVAFPLSPPWERVARSAGRGAWKVYAAYGPALAHSARAFANATVALGDGQARSLTHCPSAARPFAFARSYTVCCALA